MVIGGFWSGILFFIIKDKVVFYVAYMLFVKNGGFFIFINKQYKLGEEVFLLLNLMEEIEKILVVGKIVWIMFRGVQGNCVVGIGV